MLIRFRMRENVLYNTLERKLPLPLSLGPSLPTTSVAFKTLSSDATAFSFAGRPVLLGLSLPSMTLRLQAND